MSNMYQSPAAAAIANPSAQINTDPRAIQEHFEDFYEDIFEELAKYGEIEGLNVCDNTSDHLIGNVYVKFREEESALAALNALSGRFYSGRPILCEFSPVTDFRESTCRQYEENTCNRGGYCNFMHLKPISRQLRKILFGRYKRRDDRDDRDDRGREATIAVVAAAGGGATPATVGGVPPAAATAAAGRTGAGAATTTGGATGRTTGAATTGAGGRAAGTGTATTGGATIHAAAGATGTTGTAAAAAAACPRRACRTRTGGRCSPSGTRRAATRTTAGMGPEGTRPGASPRRTIATVAESVAREPRADARAHGVTLVG